MNTRRRFSQSLVGCLVLCVATLIGAQQSPPQPPAPPPVQQPIVAVDPQFNPASVERGQQLIVSQCGFCHGSNARGGSSGPDLTRSVLVQDDEGGTQLGEFLRTGRPDKGMPAFQLAADQVTDLATFLHAAIFLNANRRLYKVLDILTGDPKAGEAFFNGAGRCSMCHSTTGDLRGIGAKYEPVLLQQRLLMPRGARGAGPAGPPQPAHLDKNAIKVTVTLPSRQTISGALVRLTDFDVTLYDPASGRIRSWPRNGEMPKIDVVDPLQAHIDLWTKWSDGDMHNMTAYLAGLK
jgi:cytochrome c oxidase cbb3-type subunit 3